MIYIGIDPGLSGGLAILAAEGAVVSAVPMPSTDADVFAHLDASAGVDIFEPKATSARAILERVSASPQMGVTSAFTFGKGYGGLRMALTAAGIPFDEVTPQKWQKAMQCLTGGDKNVSKRRAQQLFPQVKITHAIADALLIAEYCRRFHLGMLG